MTTNSITPAYQQLLTIGMAHWVPALMILLQHYEGIERALEPEEQPLNYLAHKLKQISKTPMTDRERLFFDIVSTMPLFYYRAAGDGIPWTPVSETFHEFECRVEGTVFIWQEWTPHLSKNDVINWLYENLVISGDAWITA